MGRKQELTSSDFLCNANGQQCLAKPIIDHISLQWFNTEAYSNTGGLLTHMKLGNVECRQCRILRLARFTEPLPDKDSCSCFWNMVQISNRFTNKHWILGVYDFHSRAIESSNGTIVSRIWVEVDGTGWNLRCQRKWVPSLLGEWSQDSPIDGPCTGVGTGMKIL